MRPTYITRVKRTSFLVSLTRCSFGQNSEIAEAIFRKALIKSNEHVVEKQAVNEKKNKRIENNLFIIIPLIIIIFIIIKFCSFSRV